MIRTFVVIAAGAGVGLAAAIMSQPRWLARALASHSGDVIFAVSTTRPQVALTFDDGPHCNTTPALLEVLRKHAARATFFVIGSRAQGHPELIRQVAEAGHELGNHVWVGRPSILSSSMSFERDLIRAQGVLTAILGTRPAFVRPASGWFSPAMLGIARRHAYCIALGSIATRDLGLRHPQHVFQFIIRRVQPGAIIVLHEEHPVGSRLAALTDQLLEDLHKRGLQPVTLSEMIHQAGS